MVTWVILSVFIGVLLVGAPIGVALALSSGAVLYFMLNIPLVVVAQRMFTSVDSFSYMAVPFFMLAGAFMSAGGVTKRIVNFASCLVGSMAGGLAQVVAVSGMFFAALSGSSAATTAAIGSAMIDEMEERGYGKAFAAAVVAAAGTVGIVIPPSITMVVYGVVAECSIGDLFLAGFIPGIIMGLSMCVVNYVIAKKRGYRGKEATVPGETWRTFKECFWALLMPAIIIGGIYGGIFTPTESAAVAAVYGAFIGMFVYGELKWKDIPTVLLKAAMSTTMIMFVVGGANVFGWILTNAQVPHKLGALFASITSSPVVFLILVNLMLLFLGTLINASAAVVIVTPILLPVALSMGIDPIFFGAIMVVNLAIGCITPPVGLDLFVVSSITGISIDRVIQEIMPYLLVLLVVLLFLTYFPAVTLLLPNLLGG